MRLSLCFSSCAGFNPRLRVGGDPDMLHSLAHAAGFNPRLRVGGDSCQPVRLPLQSRFNPRLRVGGDASYHIRQSLLLVSIHASAWEATAYCSAGRLRPNCFNPRLRVGGDRGRPQPARIKVLRGPFRESAVWRCPAFRIFYSYTIIVLYSNMLDVSRIFLQKAVNLRSPLQKINGPSGS